MNLGFKVYKCFHLNILFLYLLAYFMFQVKVSKKYIDFYVKFWRPNVWYEGSLITV